MTEPERSVRALGPVMARVGSCLEGVGELLVWRGEEESAAATQRATMLEEIERAFESATRGARSERDDALRAAAAEHEADLASLGAGLDREIRTVRANLERQLGALHERVEKERTRTKKEMEEARWICDTVSESDERQTKVEYRSGWERREKVRARLRELEGRAVTTAEAVGGGVVWKRSERGGGPEAGSAEADGEPEALTVEAGRAAGRIEELLVAWGELTLPKVAWGSGFTSLAVFGVLVGSGLGYLAVWAIAGWHVFGLGAILGAAAVGGLAVPARAMLGRMARGRIDQIGAMIDGEMASAERGLAVADRVSARRRDARLAEVRETARAEIDRIDRAKEEQTTAFETASSARESELRATLGAELESLEARRGERMAEVESSRGAAVSAATKRFEQDTGHVRGERDRASASVGTTCEERMAGLIGRWRERSTELAGEIAELESMHREIAPPWEDSAWEAWSPPRETRVCVPIMRAPLDIGALPGGLSEGSDLAWPGPTRVELPVALELPRVGSVLIETDSATRDVALEAARETMLRLLTTLPTGKVRFTIIDPVGLGQSFAAFMHLADHEERLVSGRIWTDPRHIEQRLLDLTEHMERVIQKYLRNEFASIEDYNRQAGEIAEPYRYLVIADFPTNVTDVAAGRLASIADSGARCGVHTIMVADPSAPTPGGVSLDDFRKTSLVVGASAGVLRSPGAGLGEHELARPATPEPARMTQLLNAVGLHATDATLVQVPFDAVAPSSAERWTRSSAEGLVAPLGRKGATRLQELELGKGMLQHALIAGKTGSGKSTLLHVLITSATLWYSPDELELYLVDFKKGVEFRAYAEHELPHARVVAIETDREFGLSVLRRLDEELTRRGEQFRAAGVQSLPEFRVASRDRMPRTLLIVDEFQELFVEDDAVAQQSGLLLDRLVRQGRAFGMHVVLGSQTLGGAYSIPRTTMSQMNVRVALQCDEQDSYLILSEDNAAARLLERPGEAIYNDAAGRVEGNSPFQVVWAPSERRDAALMELRALARERGVEVGERIVFEGNVPADPSRNGELRAAAVAVAANDPVRLYLGEPTAIAPSTAVTLRRQGGANLLMVGQRAETARAISTMVGVSFALQHAASPGARLVVLDGTPADAMESERGPSEVVGRLPVDVRCGGVGDAEALVAELAMETERRQQIGASGEPSVLMLIHGLHRFRDLRKSSDFGFSMSDDAAEPLDAVFGRILEQGPEVGIHVVAWCDTAMSLERTLDRRTLREFDQRVMMQMSAMDSTALMDSPAASKLGPNRALLWSDEAGRATTFRPYASPALSWLADVLGTHADRPT